MTASSTCQIDRLHFKEDITEQQSSLFFQGIIDNYIKLNRPFSLVIDSALLADVRDYISIAALLHSENDTRVVVGTVPYSNIYQKSYRNIKLVDHIKASIRADEHIHTVMSSFPDPVSLDTVLGSIPIPDYTFAGTTELRSYDYSHLFEQVVTTRSSSSSLDSITAFLGVRRENTHRYHHCSHAIYAPILSWKHLYRSTLSSPWISSQLAIIGQEALAIVATWTRLLRPSSSIRIPSGYEKHCWWSLQLCPRRGRAALRPTSLFALGPQFETLCGRSDRGGREFVTGTVSDIRVRFVVIL